MRPGVCVRLDRGFGSTTGAQKLELIERGKRTRQRRAQATSQIPAQLRAP